MTLNNKVYNVLKWVVQIVLPAFGALYFSLSEMWGLPMATEVVGTTAVVATFLGATLGITARAYHKSDAPYDGTIRVMEAEDVVKYSLDLGDNLETLPQRKAITFKVDSTPFE